VSGVVSRALCSNAAASAAKFVPNGTAANGTFVSSYNNLTDKKDIITYLQRHSLMSKPVNEHVVVQECPFCHATGGKIDNQWKLYILNRNGCFKCFRCSSQGSWFDFKNRIQGKNGKASISVAPLIPAPAAPAAPAATVLRASEVHAEHVKNRLGNEEAMHYLTQERGLSPITLEKYGVGLTRLSFGSGAEWCYTFPWFDEESKMIRYKARAIEAKQKQRLVPKGGGWSLFGMNTVGDADEVVLTEGEFDAMAVYEATGKPAISLPNGAGSLPPEILPMLERFSRIYLWMDHDTAGVEAVPKFVKKLGMARTFVVSGLAKDPETGKSTVHKDANDAMRAGADLKAMLSAAEPQPHGQILDFEALRD